VLNFKHSHLKHFALCTAWELSPTSPGESFSSFLVFTVLFGLHIAVMPVFVIRMRESAVEQCCSAVLTVSQSPISASGSPGPATTDTTDLSKVNFYCIAYKLQMAINTV